MTEEYGKEEEEGGQTDMPRRLPIEWERERERGRGRGREVGRVCSGLPSKSLTTNWFVV